MTGAAHRLVALVVLSFPWTGAALGAVPLSHKDLQQLREAPRGAEALKIEGFPLEDGRRVDLELTRLEVWKPDTRIVIHTPTGDVPGTIPDDVYYRGSVTGDPRSLVWFATGRTTRGMISTEDAVYVVGPERDAYRSADPGDTIRLRRLDPGFDRSPMPFRCGAEGLVPDDPAFSVSGTGSPTPRANWTTTYNIDVAIETDYELYATTFGGNLAAELQFIGDLVAGAAAIYYRDVKTTFRVPYVSLWTTAADPWSSWGAGQMQQQLYELGDYWHANHSFVDVPRTIVHMLSGKDLQGGIAYIGVLCRSDFYFVGAGHWGLGYGLIGSVQATFSTTAPASFGTWWDIFAFTHEIGHNFNSKHTHCYSPPVDQCYSGEVSGGTSCYSGATSVPAGGGTIMSYCHELGWGNTNLVFGIPGQASEAVLTQMRDHVETRGACVCQVPDAAVGVSPAAGATGVTAGTLTWTNTLAAPSGTPQTPDSGVTSYDVFFDTVNPPVHRVSFGSVTPSAALPVWFPNLTYYWQVVSKNGCGSASSPVYSFTTGACPWTGAAPTLSSPSAGATNQARKLNLSWNAVAGAANYWVYLGTSNPPTLRYAVLPAPRTSFAVSLSPGTTYYWSVEAHPGCGNQSAVNSTVRSFTTAAATPPPGPAVPAMTLTSASPGFLNRWAGGALTATGTNLSSNNSLFVDLFGRSGGTFTFGSQTTTQVTGTLAANATAPAGFYDVGLTYWGFENLRLPGALTLRAFTDVTESDFFFLSSSRVADAGVLEADFDAVAAGPQLSPTTVVTRALMAQYLAQAHEWWRTGSPTLPTATCVPSGGGSTDFPDVPCAHPNWLAIHWIKTWGITLGANCVPGPGLCYLPDGSVTRSQMVTFLERLKYGPEGSGTVLQGLLNGSGLTDPGCGAPYPTCSGWTDAQLQVPAATWPHAQVNVAFQDRLTNGCSGSVGNNLGFCAGTAVTRGQISEFLARILSLVPTP